MPFSVHAIIRKLITSQVGWFCLLLLCALLPPSVSALADAPSFDPVTGIIRHAQQVAPLADGKIVALGDAGMRGEVSELVRFNADGTTDATFRPGHLGFASIASIIPLPSGQVLVAGEEDSTDGASSVNRLVRLNADGGMDEMFHPGAEYSDTPIALPDGKLLLEENDAADGPALTKLERLSNDGMLDPQFSAAIVFDPNREYNVHLQNDGKLLVGSNGEEATPPTLVRLNADGSADSSFVVPLLPAGTLTSILPLSDGKVAAALSTDLGNSNVVLRFNDDGTIDPAFHQATTFDDTISSLVLLPDGGLIAVGDFRFVNSVPRHGLARLGPDGTLDIAYRPFDGAANIPFSALVGPVGNVLLLLNGESRESFTAMDSHPLVRRFEGVDDGFAPPPGPAVTIVNQEPDDGFAPPPAPGARIVRGPPVVTIMAARPELFSGSAEPGQFVLQRTGNRYAQSVRVVFRVGGTALPGQDYRALGCVRIIPAGQQYASINIRPVGERFGAVAQGHVGVMLTLVRRPGYHKGLPLSAKIKIIEPEVSSNRQH